MYELQLFARTAQAYVAVRQHSAADELAGYARVMGYVSWRVVLVEKRRPLKPKAPPGMAGIYRRPRPRWRWAAPK